jgi:addiction module HigA family antidote
MSYVMKDPPHVGEFLKSELAELHIKIAPFARALGVGQVGLHRVLAGDRALTPEMALRVEAAIGIDADLLSGMQHQWDMAQARKHRDEIVAGVTKLEVAA